MGTIERDFNLPDGNGQHIKLETFTPIWTEDGRWGRFFRRISINAYNWDGGSLKPAPIEYVIANVEGAPALVALGGTAGLICHKIPDEHPYPCPKCKGNWTECAAQSYAGYLISEHPLDAPITALHHFAAWAGQGKLGDAEVQRWAVAAYGHGNILDCMECRECYLDTIGGDEEDDMDAAPMLTGAAA